MDDRPTAFVMLPHGFDAALYRAAFARGEVPDETPYGFHLAEEQGWRLIFSADRPEGRLRGILRRQLRRVIGFDLLHAWSNRDRLAEADVAWTMTEWEWLGLRCIGRLAPRCTRPIVGNTVWLFNEWEGIGPLRRWLARRLARGRGVLTVHSDGYLPIARQALPGVPVERSWFGVDVPEDDQLVPAARQPAAGDPLRILALGSDWTRDWDTFLAAFGGDERFTIDLVCAGVGAATRARHANLLPREPAAALSRAELRRLYAWSDVVVVPMVENRFSGITSAIDAAGRGKPVVSTRTGGVPTYFDEGEVVYVAPGDTASLRDAALLPAERLAEVARAGQARFRRSDYSAAGMVARYVALSRKVLRDPPVGAHNMD